VHMSATQLWSPNQPASRLRRGSDGWNGEREREREREMKKKEVEKTILCAVGEMEDFRAEKKRERRRPAGE